MLRSTWCVFLLVIVAGCAAKPTGYRYAEAKSPATSHCLKSGTHIESKEGNCSAPGRSSGSLNDRHVSTAAGALHDLDPAITIRQ